MTQGDILTYALQFCAAVSLFCLALQLWRQKKAKGKVHQLIQELEEGRRSYHLLKYRAESNRMLMEISNLFIHVSEEELDDSITESLGVLGKFLKADRAFAYLFADNHKSFSKTHGWAKKGIRLEMDSLQDLPMRDYAWFTDRILRRQQVQIPKTSAIPNEGKLLRDALVKEKVQSMIAVPMISRGTVLGFMGLDSVTKARTWLEDESAALRVVAEIAASEFSHRDSEQEARSNRGQFETLIAYAPVAMFVFDPRGRILFAEGRALARAGVIAGQLVGKSGFDLLSKSPEMLLSLERGISGQDFRSEIRLGDRVFDGQFTPVLGKGDSIEQLIVIATDVTDRSTAEDRLSREKLYDKVTQMPNRTLFLDRVQQYLDRQQHGMTGSGAILFLDLDRFVNLHDALGLESANHFLAQVAGRLREFFAPTTLMARVGTNEFAVLVENTPDEKKARSLAAEVQSNLRDGFLVDERRIAATASIGIALSSVRHKSPADWLREGHTAMVSAKQLGGATEVVFAPVMHTRILSSWKLEEELNDAVRQEAIEAWLQPIVDLNDGSPVGFEALARWNHPEGGMIPPAHFIPIAEENGLIVSIGWLMLHQACKQLRACHDLHPRWKDLFVSVNLSVQQLRDPSMLERTLRILTRYGLRPRHLHLEVTEREALNTSEEVIPLLESIHRSGISLSLDDFGTGYNSLNYLNSLPVGLIKIDRSFVVNMSRSHTGHKVISTILLLAHGLELDTIAEGIETKEQLQELFDLGCRLGQGFLFAKALEPSLLADYLENGHRLGAATIGSKYPVK
ncbi:MAG: EAL domain-containing protein [Planctomycetota bacterium]